MARLAGSLGIPLMPWQRYVIDVIHEVDADGYWCYDEAVITVPRQAGKTTLMVPVYVHRLGGGRRRSLWMTAQTGDKSVKRWREAVAWMEGTPELEGLFRAIVSKSHEELRWRDTGSLLVPFTPNEQAMHGESPDLVSIDEWWAFDWQASTDITQAYEPGFLTKNAQAIKTSTAGTARSWGLNQDVAKGRRAVEMDARHGTAYFEWSLPDVIGGIPIAEVGDEELIEAAVAIHPAVGFHPTAPADKMRAVIRKAGREWDKLGGREGFLRAWGNRSAGSGYVSIIPAGAWAACLGKPIPPRVPVALGFGMDPRHGSSAIASAWRDERSGLVTAEVLWFDPDGASALPGTLRGLAQRNEHVQVAANNSGPVAEAADAVDLHPDWPEQWKVLRLSAPVQAAACQRLFKEATASVPTFRHIGQPELTLGVETAKKRRVGTGGGWAWESGDYSIAELDAVTAAVWAADHPRPKTGKLWFA